MDRVFKLVVFDIDKRAVGRLPNKKRAEYGVSMLPVVTEKE